MHFEEELKKWGNGWENKPIWVTAPGRINLIGEHTDYNNGFVFPAAIDKSVFFLLQLRDDKNCIIDAKDINAQLIFSIEDNLKPSSNSWENYFLGVLHFFKEKGEIKQGFNVIFKSDIPIGAGMSSSAALSCGFGMALNEAFNLSLKKSQIAEIAQLAEHHFVGVKCGIMDQYACMFGLKNHALKLDCRTLKYQLQEIDLGEHKLVLIDSKVKHELSSTEYNNRRDECDRAVAIMKNYDKSINTLRDVSHDHLLKFGKYLDRVAYMRCKYVIMENERVEKASQALNSNNLKLFGELLNQSHKGLSDYYEVSCDELNFLVNVSKESVQVLGSRMMGGGFGGCTINIVAESNCDLVVSTILNSYKKEFGIDAQSYSVQIEDGCRVMDYN